MIKRTQKKGFTVFFAVLVSSLALAVGIAIWDLTIRELNLSATATQSQYAIYAADMGSECALYWDYHYAGNPSLSAYATSSTYAGAPGGDNSVVCNSIAVRTDGGAAWTVISNAGAATTTFTLNFTTQSRPYCAKLQIEKWGNPARTRVTSRGYNTCTANSNLILERSLQLTY